jgi:hypothetical protein
MEANQILKNPVPVYRTKFEFAFSRVSVSNAAYSPEWSLQTTVPKKSSDGNYGNKLHQNTVLCPGQHRGATNEVWKGNLTTDFG